MIFYIFILSSFFIFSSVDLIVFSYDRPLQLFAFLESTKKFVSGLGEISIIYRYSDENYEKAYQKVFDYFVDMKINCIKQIEINKSDFKPILLNAIKNGPSEYLYMAVDDIVVTDYIDLDHCVYLMEKAKNEFNHIFGFYLRLGQNITLDYSGKFCLLPTFVKFENTLIWNIKEAQGYWEYPNSVDCIIYNKDEILPQIEKVNFNSPNTFEGQWNVDFFNNRSNYGICYEFSKIINIPINLVQDDINNFHLNYYSKNELLNIFFQGYKIEIRDFNFIKPNKCHVDLKYKFIKNWESGCS